MEKLKTKVSIKILFTEDSVAKAVYSSLVPDNVRLPDGLELSMYVEQKTLIVSFCSIGNPKSLISTVDEVLELCQLSTNVMLKS